MKRESFAIIFACLALGLAAQDGIRVNFQGANPTISDLAWAYLSSYDDVDDDEDCADESFNAVRYAWVQHMKGLPQEEGVTLTIDQKNGFVLYEYKSEYEAVEDLVSVKDLVRIEMCYWNEADGKHKLFAYNVACFRDGEYNPGQFDGLTFFRYDNASRTMTMCDPPGFEVEFSAEDGSWVSHALPRTGKDIIVTTWHESGETHETLKWNGRRFTR